MDYCRRCALWRQVENGLCRDCRMCINCGRRERTRNPNPGVPEDLYCETCRCVVCRTPAGFARALQQMPWDRNSHICATCVQNHEASCRICHRRIAWAVDIWGDRERICQRCADELPRELRCGFCRRQATGARNFLDERQDNRVIMSCGTCMNIHSCFLNGCRPGRLCVHCRQQNRERRAQRAAEQGANRRVPQGHDAEDDDCQCVGCRQARQGAFFFSFPTPRFWPKEKRNPHYIPPLKERVKNRSPRALAAEMEISGKNAPPINAPAIERVVFKWRGGIVRDGSLGDTGFEINLAPAAGDAFLNQVDEVCDVLRKNKAYADKKAGLHIHVDARDHNYADIAKLIRGYVKVEDALLQTQRFSRIHPQGRQRHPGGFTRPCAPTLMAALNEAKMLIGKDSGSIARDYRADKKKKLIYALYGDVEEPPRNDHYNDARYSALNIHSWFYRGTIEFRIHAGTIKAKNIKTWGMLCTAFVDSMFKMTDKEISMLNGTPKENLLAVLPKKFHPYLFQRWEKFKSEWQN